MIRGKLPSTQAVKNFPGGRGKPTRLNPTLNKPQASEAEDFGEVSFIIICRRVLIFLFFVKEFKRATGMQKERIVQLVQNNFLETVGRFSGVNGVEIKKELWQQYTRELNTLGPAKTHVQWKNVVRIDFYSMIFSVPGLYKTNFEDETRHQSK